MGIDQENRCIKSEMKVRICPHGVVSPALGAVQFRKLITIKTLNIRTIGSEQTDQKIDV